MIHRKLGWLGYCDVPAIVIYVVGFDEMAKFAHFLACIVWSKTECGAWEPNYAFF